MHDKLNKILGKKRDLSPAEKNAKMDVMKEMRDEASKAMGDKMDHLKKVSVMSNSPEGLSHGLEKAKQLIGSQNDQEMSDGGQVMSDEEEHQMQQDAENDLADAEHAHEEHEGEEDYESPEEAGYPDESSEDESVDSIEAKIQELMKKKESLAKR